MRSHSRPTPRRRAALRRRRGGAVVEAAIVLPIFFLLLFGIMEYGRYLMILQIFTNAAREGSRYAVAHTQPVTLLSTTTGNATSDVTNTIASFLAGQKLASQNVQVYLSDSLGNNLGTWTNAAPGQFVCVKITGNYLTTVPKLVFLPSSIPVRIVSVMYCEAN